MPEDRGQRLHETHVERRTSSAAKIAGYGSIVLLIIAIFLLATGIVNLGQP